MNYAVPISAVTIAISTAAAMMVLPADDRFDAAIIIGQGGLVLAALLSVFFVMWFMRSRLLLEIGPSKRSVSVPALPRFDAPARRLEREEIGAVRCSLDDQVLIQTNDGLVYKKRASLVTASGEAVPLRRFPSASAACRFTSWLAERLGVPHEERLEAKDRPAGGGPSAGLDRDSLERHGFRV